MTTATYEQHKRKELPMLAEHAPVLPVAQPDDQRSDISISFGPDSKLTLDATTMRLHPRHQSAPGLVDLLGCVAVASGAGWSRWSRWISDELDAMMIEHDLGHDEHDKLQQIIAILEAE